MKTEEANKEILRILTDYLTKNPDIRFGQALYNLNINKWSDDAIEKINSPIPNDGNYTFEDNFSKPSQSILNDITPF
jgi:hypothetical protein